MSTTTTSTLDVPDVTTACDAPIYRLPTELLVRIFSTLVHMILSDYITIGHHPVVAYENKPKVLVNSLRGVPWVCLPCVSRGWRTAADLCSDLWTTVNFWTHEPTERLLLKSKGQGLHLVYYEGPRYLPSDPDVFISAASSGILARARTITFIYCDEGPRPPVHDRARETVLDLVLRNPSRTVQEHNIFGQSTYPWPHYEGGQDIVLFPRPREDHPEDDPLYPPSLRVLRLRRLILPNRPRFIQYPLICLEVTQCSGSWDNVVALLDTLSHLPTLQTVVLVQCFIPESDLFERDTIHLPSLARLTLDLSEHTVLPLLRHVRFPRSTIVTVRSKFSPASGLGTASDHASIQNWIHLLLLHFAASPEGLDSSESQPALDVVEFVFRNIKQLPEPCDRSLHIEGYRYVKGIETRALDVHLSAEQPRKPLLPPPPPSRPPMLMPFHAPMLTLISSGLSAFVSSIEDQARQILNESIGDSREMLFYYERIAKRNASTSRSAMALCRPFPSAMQFSSLRLGELIISPTGVGSPADDTGTALKVAPLIHLLNDCFWSMSDPEISSILDQIAFVRPNASYAYIFDELQEKFGDKIKFFF